jgi:hypothetical protein
VLPIPKSFTVLTAYAGGKRDVDLSSGYEQILASFYALRSTTSQGGQRVRSLQLNVKTLGRTVYRDEACCNFRQSLGNVDFTTQTIQNRSLRVERTLQGQY